MTSLHVSGKPDSMMLTRWNSSSKQADGSENQPLNFRRVERQTSDATGIRHTGVEQRPIDIAGHIAHRTRGVVALGHAQIYVVEYILGIGRAPDMVAHIAEKLLLVRFHIIGQLSYEFVPVHAV